MTVLENVTEGITLFGTVMTTAIGTMSQPPLVYVFAIPLCGAAYMLVKRMFRR